jgi:hypothetical protein
MIGPDSNPEAAIMFDHVAGADFIAVDFHLSTRICVGYPRQSCGGGQEWRSKTTNSSNRQEWAQKQP